MYEMPSASPYQVLVLAGTEVPYRRRYLLRYGTYRRYGTVGTYLRYGTEAELIAASSACDKALFVLPPT